MLSTPRPRRLRVRLRDGGDGGGHLGRPWASSRAPARARPEEERAGPSEPPGWLAPGGGAAVTSERPGWLAPGGGAAMTNARGAAGWANAGRGGGALQLGARAGAAPA